LDHAATAAVRPPEVADAVAAYIREVGATPGRSSHARALSAGRVALRCRRLLAELFGIPGDPGRIAMQFNATHALNTALFGILRPGDTVVRTILDHNSIRRPVAALVETGVRERRVGLDSTGRIDLLELEQILREEADRVRLLALPHASNVTAAILPVREMAELAHSAGALVMLDAAQTAGHLPFSVQELGVDLLAFTGHKGLLGPQGTGGLWVRDGVDVAPLLRGGTGGDSLLRSMPDAYPDHLEAGTMNGPGIAGLLAGVEWVLGQTPEAIHRHVAGLTARLRDGLEAVRGVRVHSPPAPDGVGVVTITADGVDAPTLARRLDVEHGILVRAGLHCAPEVHRLLGTDRSGAVRFSLGWASTAEEVDRAVEAVANVMRA